MPDQEEIQAFGLKWYSTRTGPQHDSLPPVRIHGWTPGVSVQDYLTPDQARALAAALVRVADEVDADTEDAATTEAKELADVPA